MVLPPRTFFLGRSGPPEKPENDILLPFLVQCWVGRTQHRGDSSSPSRAWPVWEAGVGNHLFTQEVPQTGFTSLGLSTKFPSHSKFLIPSEGAGKKWGMYLSQEQADEAVFLPSIHSLWWHQNNLCSSLLRPWARILKEAAGRHSFQEGPQADPKFRKSASNKENQSALRLGDGQSPTTGLQMGFPGSPPQVTQATSGGAPCWLKLSR